MASTTRTTDACLRAAMADRTVLPFPAQRAANAPIAANPAPPRPEASTTLPDATSGRDNLAGANLPFDPHGNRPGLSSEPTPSRVLRNQVPLHVLISPPPYQPLDPERRAALEWASRHRDAFDRAGIFVGLFGVAWMIGRSLPAIVSFLLY